MKKMSNNDKIRGELACRRLSKKAKTFYETSDVNVWKTVEGQIYWSIGEDDPVYDTFESMQTTFEEWADEENDN